MAKYSPKILVVDDNEDNRYTLHRRLKKDGYSEISLANGGQEALDIVYEESFDLILLDLMMPDISGLEVLQQVKSDPDLRHIPVIMVTASDDVERRSQVPQSSDLRILGRNGKGEEDDEAKKAKEGMHFGGPEGGEHLQPEDPREVESKEMEEGAGGARREGAGRRADARRDGDGGAVAARAAWCVAAREDEATTRGGEGGHRGGRPRERAA